MEHTIIMREDVVLADVVHINEEDTIKKMRLKNILIVVNDIELSKKFYQDIFGLQVMTDFGRNVILTEGLVLQEKALWEEFVQRKVTPGGNGMELYFEHNDLDAFAEKLEASAYEINYINRLMEHEWGQRVIRFYDPDMHVIEVGESLEYVNRKQGGEA